MRRVSDLVRIEVDEEIQKLYPDPRSMIVEIRDKKGNTASARIDHAKGDAENPMSDEELFEKFRDVTGELSPLKRRKDHGGCHGIIHTRGEIASFTEMLHI